MTGLDFAAILDPRSGTSIDLGGFTLHEVAFLYAGTGLGIAFGDLVVGRVERLGQMIRLGRLDTMMTKPVPLLVQVLRRRVRAAPAGPDRPGRRWSSPGPPRYVDWDPAVARAADVLMLVAATLIFTRLFIGLAASSSGPIDSAEVANAFTYGGNTVTSVPAHHLSRARWSR